MRKLYEPQSAWKNYLYAYQDGRFNDVEDFLIRVQLINDCHIQILETMLENEPNMDLVKECKKEIAYQRTMLHDIIVEYLEYYNPSSEQKLSVDSLLDDLCKAGRGSYLYEVAEEWHICGTKAHQIWETLSNSKGGRLDSLHDDLCRLYMENYIQNECPI